MEKNIFSEIFFGLINFWLFIGSAEGILNKKTWTYELKEIKTTTSDHEKLKIEVAIERVSRGVYAISGEIYLNIDVAEGDSNKIQAKSYRSVQGDGDFHILPFQLPNTHVYKVLNTHYKDILMNTLKECSDMPFFENTFQPPLEKKVYTMEACQFSQDGLPNHMQDGLYKLSIIGSGEVDWQVDIFAEITSDI